MGQSENTNTVWLAKDDHWVRVRLETVKGMLVATLHNSAGETATISLDAARERIATLLHLGWTVR